MSAANEEEFLPSPSPGEHDESAEAQKEIFGRKPLLASSPTRPRSSSIGEIMKRKREEAVFPLKKTKTDIGTDNADFATRIIQQTNSIKSAIEVKPFSKAAKDAIMNSITELRVIALAIKKRPEEATIMSALSEISKNVGQLNSKLDEATSRLGPSLPQSYADITKFPATAQDGKEIQKRTIQTTTHALVISHPTAASSKEVERNWKEKISFKNRNFAPGKVTHLSNKKIRVLFDSKKESEAVLNMLKDTEFHAEEAKKRKPLFILKGVNKEIQAEELTNIIIRQNPQLNEIGHEDITFKFMRKNRNEKLYNAVYEAKPAIWKTIMNTKRINIDHQRVHVEEFSPFLQCYNCLQFGHTQNKCAENPKCSHCSGDHKYKDCQHKDDKSKKLCFNCGLVKGTAQIATNANHSATSGRDCPRVASMIKRINERIDYDG